MVATWLKSLTRDARLKLYHSMHGQGFRFHGIEIEVPQSLPFGIKKQLMQNRYEKAETILVEKYLQSALPVIELGGSMGALSSFIAGRLASGVPYHIIEANPQLVDICARNAERGNQVAQIKVHNLAIACGVDEIGFFTHENIHVGRIESSHVTGNVRVPAMSLSAFSAQNSIDGQFTLIMDIEGAEYDLFEGDPSAFENCALAIVEIHPHIFEQNGSSATAFMQLVDKAGMKSIDQYENTHVLIRK